LLFGGMTLAAAIPTAAAMSISKSAFAVAIDKTIFRKKIVNNKT